LRRQVRYHGIGACRPVGWQRVVRAAFELGGLLRICCRIGLEASLPGAAARSPGLARIPCGAHIVGHFERGVWPLQRAAQGRDAVGAERRAVHVGSALVADRAFADGRAAHDQCRLGTRLSRRLHAICERCIERVQVVAVDRANHAPAAGAKTSRRVVGEPICNVTVDADAVVVVQRDQLAQAQRAGQRDRLLADALHQAAVADADEGAVIDHRVAVAVEFGRQQRLGERHPDRIGQALAERAGGGFDAGRHADLRMAGRLAAELAKASQLVERQCVAGEVQQRVQQHRRMAVAEHEPIPIGPQRIARVMAQVSVPQHGGHLGHAERRAGVTAPGLLHRIGGQHAHAVGHALQLRAVERLRGGRQRCVHRVNSRRFRSIRRRIIGVKINCIASPILPPGQTMLLGRLIHEPCSIDSRYGKSMPLGLAKRITTIDSSALGMSLAMNGLLVSTVGTRWKLTWVRLNCGQMCFT
jgi:hypothetical protein